MAISRGRAPGDDRVDPASLPDLPPTTGSFDVVERVREAQQAVARARLREQQQQQPTDPEPARRGGPGSTGEDR